MINNASTLVQQEPILLLMEIKESHAEHAQVDLDLSFQTENVSKVLLQQPLKQELQLLVDKLHKFQLKFQQHLLLQQLQLNLPLQVLQLQLLQTQIQKLLLIPQYQQLQLFPKP